MSLRTDAQRIIDAALKAAQPDTAVAKALASAQFGPGRLVLVARCCFDAGYLSEEEAWRYITAAQTACKKHYSTWRELACGYLIGRAMWSGAGTSLDGLMAIADGLLEDNGSPWLAVPFLS